MASGKEQMRNYNNAAQRLIESYYSIYVQAPPRRHRGTVRYPYSSKRQHDRYARQCADERQRNSHKPGAVQPKHIFGVPA